MNDVIERLTKLSKVGFGYDIKPEDREALRAAVVALSTSPAGVVKPQYIGLKGASEIASADLASMSAIEPAGVGVETPPPSSHVEPEPGEHQEVLDAIDACNSGDEE